MTDSIRPRRSERGDKFIEQQRAMPTDIEGLSQLDDMDLLREIITATSAVIDGDDPWEAVSELRKLVEEHRIRMSGAGWRSVEHDLPNTCRRVLIAYEDGTVSEATWLPEQGDFQGQKLQYVSHWMDLPNPPEEG